MNLLLLTGVPFPLQTYIMSQCSNHTKLPSLIIANIEFGIDMEWSKYLERLLMIISARREAGRTTDGGGPGAFRIQHNPAKLAISLEYRAGASAHGILIICGD